MEPFPEIHTDRLKLIQIKQKHLGDLFDLFSEPQVTQYYNIVTLTKKQEAQKYLDWFESRYKEGAGIRWGICLKEDDTVMGTIGFNNYTSQHRANIGYDLRSEFWNRGIISEALKAVVEFGFSKLQINRIEAEVMQGNIASERVLEKLGFTKEGILRDWMYWNEKHYDMTMYSLLRAEHKTALKND